MADAAYGARTGMAAALGDRGDIFIAAGVVAAVMMMIIPMPTFLLDSLMAMNLIMGLLVLLIVCTQRKLPILACFRLCCSC